MDAKLTHDTETFGKMDPYCIFETRMQRIRTKVCQGAGKTPNWNGELIEVDVKYIGDDLHISVWDEDPGKDDLIAEATIKLSAMCTGGGMDEWYLLQYKGKNAGHIHLRTNWHPDGRQLEVIVPGMAKPVLITTDGQLAQRQV